ncbi:MAG: hypothetical protein WD011_01750 [Nitriliruptoraceae bacterium]
MQFEELRFVCQQAAVDLVASRPRPVPATVVLPGPQRTELVTLPGFPADNEDRHRVLAQLAVDRITTEQIPCWGFIAEAEVESTDVVVVVYGARRHQPQVTASAFGDDGQLDAFVAAEPLDATAMPFLHPLQHAVDAVSAVGDVFDAVDPKRGSPDGGHHH